MRRPLARVVGLLCCLAILSSLAAAPAAAQADEERFRVGLDTEGNADVSVTYAYDMNSDDERRAFEDLRENTTFQQETAEQFENRMAAVAADASRATDREMAVGDAAVTVERDGDVGLVTLTVSWTNLAAVDGGQLTVTEPFASGFEPDRQFTVAMPDGYDVVSATPEPEGTGDASVSWAAGTSLDGFELVAESDAAAETDDDGAGFGAIVAVLGLVTAALVAPRRR